MLEPPSTSASSAVASSAVASSAAASGMSNFGLIFPDVVTRSLFNFKLIRNIGQLPEKKKAKILPRFLCSIIGISRASHVTCSRKKAGESAPGLKN